MTFQEEEIYVGGGRSKRVENNCKQIQKAVILDVKGQWLKTQLGKWVIYKLKD